MPELTEEQQSLLDSVGAMLRDIREGYGWTQRQAAEVMGTTQAQAHYIETGARDVKLITLMRWAEAYDYELEIRLVPKEDEFDKALREAMEELDEEPEALHVPPGEGSDGGTLG